MEWYTSWHAINLYPKILQVVVWYIRATSSHLCVMKNEFIKQSTTLHLCGTVHVRLLTVFQCKGIEDTSLHGLHTIDGIGIFASLRAGLI